MLGDRPHWRSRRQFLLFAASAAALVACRRRLSVAVPRAAAAGRPETCPDSPIAAPDENSASADTMRCSYDDAIGQNVTQLRGRVAFEADPMPEPAPGLAVAVHQAEGVLNPRALGEPLLATESESDGRFAVAGFLKPGAYWVVAKRGSEVLAYTRIDVRREVERELEVSLIVPAGRG